MAVTPESTLCADCGLPLTSEPWAAGLCLRCLAELAREDPDAEADLLGDTSAAPTLGYTEETLQSGVDAPAPGEIRGDRYRIRSLLGRGGMGEVWRAFDLKLRVDVALKSLHSELVADPAALELLRQEVRSAREVISPNVCRVYDLEELEGQELVSMEYVDGKTLQELLGEQGPLELNRAREIASQFLAGLEAIHTAGLMHQDIKPENVMVTRTGRVVVMDFGIAKSLESGKSGIIAGTPAYMSPEHSRGTALDARADVFAAGVVLAEMVDPAGSGSLEQRQEIWRGVHSSPPAVPDTPWSQAIQKAIDPDREGRYASAVALARALEEVTLRAAGDETARPYPGLASFQVTDAEYFFGRELEVEELWKRLRRPRLQAVIAPSGAGKSSFLRAGLLATCPPGWQSALALPGKRPFFDLATALGGDPAGDADAIRDLQSFEQLDLAVQRIAAWRHGNVQGLIVIDQFEELFTQNPPEVQERFAELLGRLPLEADVHVVLAMREDFLFHCQPFAALAPAFSDLMPLGALGGSSLRRALVQPALKCGYRFEDDRLVDEMVGEVSSERGSLPLLAFAASQIWDKRDRERGLLTRSAYEEIGGVGGALAQHAEDMLDRLGDEAIPVVRELMRNLVTAQGTRAARDRDALLSVFTAEGQPSAKRPASEPAGHDPVLAERVLDELIDQRLLTSYDLPATNDKSAPRTSVEVIHESLLSNWPRLVRWRAQDAEGAQLRDDLRQVAEKWEERGRPEDLLWTGTSYQEFQLWRKRYPGGLTATEERFARAMISAAEGRKRRTRLAAAVAFGLLLGVLVVVSGFWQRAERAREQAEQETLRAEAQKLQALGQLELETFPTATLAHAIKSLELTDSQEGRRLALKALWQGPPAWIEPLIRDGSSVDFSPDGQWLVQGLSGQPEEPKVRLFSSDGEGKILEHMHPGDWAGVEWLVANRGHFVSWSLGGPAERPLVDFVFWSATSGEPIGQIRDYPDWDMPRGNLFGWMADQGQVLLPWPDGRVELHSFQGGHTVTDLGRLESSDREDWAASTAIAETGRLIATIPDRSSGEILVTEFREQRLLPPRRLGRHVNVTSEDTDEFGTTLATRSDSGLIKIWKPLGTDPPLVVDGPPGEAKILRLSADGTMLRISLASEVGKEEEDTWVALLDREEPTLRYLGLHWISSGPIALDSTRSQVGLAKLPGNFAWARVDAPEGTVPIELQTYAIVQADGIAFSPQGRWVAGSGPALTLWNLEHPYPFVIRSTGLDHTWDPLGRWVAFVTDSSTGQVIELWESEGGQSFSRRTLWAKPGTGHISQVEPTPDGRHLVVGLQNPIGGSGPVLVSVADGSAEYLPGGFANWMVGVASPDGTLIAATGGRLMDSEKLVKVWNLETRELLGTLDPEDGLQHWSVALTGDNKVLWASLESGLWKWDFAADTNELVYSGQVSSFRTSSSGQQVVMNVRSEESGQELVFLDLETGRAVPLSAFGPQYGRYEIDPTGRFVVFGNRQGEIRVGPVTGEEPHLLLEHPGDIWEIDIDPLGRWVTSANRDEIRFWPMPDLSKPPTHTLPKDELLKLLKAQTNARLVEDPESPGDWKPHLEPFPGWRDSPPPWFPSSADTLSEDTRSEAEDKPDK